MTQLYRVQIIEEPEWEGRECFATYKCGPAEGDRYHGFAQCPVGWEASPGYIERFGTDRWIEPDVDKTWKSRSSAALRRDILEGAGYKVVIQRSAPVVWPKHGEKSVDASEVRQVTQAIRVLKRAGLLDSADSLLG